MSAKENGFLSSLKYCDLQKLHLSRKNCRDFIRYFRITQLSPAESRIRGAVYQSKVFDGWSRNDLSVQNTASLKKSSNLETFTSTRRIRYFMGMVLKMHCIQWKIIGGMRGRVSCENGVFQFTAIWNWKCVCWEQKLSFETKHLIKSNVIQCYEREEHMLLRVTERITFLYNKKIIQEEGI